MSKRKIKPEKPNKHKARFRSINVPVDIWPYFVDFLWAGVMNINPNTTSPRCIEFVQRTVMEAVDKKTVKIENDKIKVK